MGSADVTQIPVSSTQSVQFWAAVRTSTESLLVINQDLNNYVYIGTRNAISASALNTIPIPPNGSVSVSETRNWFVIGSVAGQSNLLVIPGGNAYFLGVTQGQGSLVLPALHSPNFVTGVSGWTIKKDGSAEFNNLTLRGTYFGNNYIQNSAGSFYYSSTPAAGNLILSDTSGGGSDQFGNHFLQGETTYSGNIAINIVNNAITVYGGSLAAGWTTTLHSFSFGSTTLSISATNQLAQSATGSGAFVTISADALGSIQLIIGGITIAQFTSSGLTNNKSETLTAQIATPPGSAGNAVLFANSNGQLIVIDGLDGSTYNTQQRTVRLTASTGAISSATPQSIGLSSTVGARTYHVYGRFYITTTSTPQFGLFVSTPSSVNDTGQIGVDIYRAATFTGSVAGNPNANLGIAITLAAAVNYIVDFDGIVTITAAGTLNVEVFNVTGGTGSYTVNAFSAIHIEPL